MDDDAFVFPNGMTQEQAKGLLAEAYAKVDAGKVLRGAIKDQRAAGHDPPGDVQYVTEVDTAPYPNGLGVSVSSDILVYDEFEGMDECVDLFEARFTEALLVALEKRVTKWERAQASAR